LLELTSEGVESVARELRAGKELVPIPILVYARTTGTATDLDILEDADDEDLVAFVDRQAR